MAKLLPTPPPEFDKLPVAASPEQVPVPEWHKRVIRERLEAYQENPTAGRLWEDVRKDIEHKLQDR